MKAVTLDYGERRLAGRDVPEPGLSAPSDVLLRVHEVGVCGTDYKLASFEIGRPPEGECYLVLGHEALGQVEAVGSGVEGLARGDWVVPMVRRACAPPCVSCARGRTDLCLTGGYTERGIVGAHGYFAEYAVDAAAHLVRVPAELVDRAILIEPLSVVEKAIETALRLREPGPRTATVLGAGTIGILAALALQQRGFDVTVSSLEPPDHPRARLIARAGIGYREGLEVIAPAGIVLEATGSPKAALAGFGLLGPLGVYGILGAGNLAGEIPLNDIVMQNQVIFGSVNASPAAFEAAIEDLACFDARIVSALIARYGFDDFESTLKPGSGEAAKSVHRLTG
ncbi:MAG: alcohol dehydrogenase catalytic domain-containing protein [Bryobacteraceae bacterium]